MVARAEKSLLKSKPDHERFVTHSSWVKIGPTSIPRFVLLADTLFRGLGDRGYTVAERDQNLVIAVENEFFLLRFYAGKDKSAHVPTKEDLNRQVEYEERRRRWPTLYSPAAGAWGNWDYHASERLALEIKGSTYDRYPDHLVGRWYDRRGKRLEQHFSDVMVALPTAAALIRHQRAEEEAKRRRRAEAEELERRAAARQARQAKREVFLDELAGQQERMERLKALARLLGRLAADDEFKLAQKLARSLDQTTAALAQRFASDALETEIRRRELFVTDDDE